MLKSSPCDYSDVYILVKGRVTTNGAGVDTAAQRVDERKKQVTFENCTPFTSYISQINNTQVDNNNDLDIARPIYNL